MTPVQSWLLMGVLVVAAFGVRKGLRLAGDVRALQLDHRARVERLDYLWDDGEAPNVLVHRTTDGTVIEYPLSEEWPLVEVAELLGRIEALPEVVV